VRRLGFSCVPGERRFVQAFNGLGPLCSPPVYIGVVQKVKNIAPDINTSFYFNLYSSIPVGRNVISPYYILDSRTQGVRHQKDGKNLCHNKNIH